MLRVSRRILLSGPSAAGKSAFLRSVRDENPAKVSLVSFAQLYDVTDGDREESNRVLARRRGHLFFEHGSFDNALYVALLKQNDNTDSFDLTRFESDFRALYETEAPAWVDENDAPPLEIILLPETEQYLVDNYTKRLRRRPWNGIDALKDSSDSHLRYVRRQIAAFDRVAEILGVPVVYASSLPDARVEILDLCIREGAVTRLSPPPATLPFLPQTDVCVLGPPRPRCRNATGETFDPVWKFGKAEFIANLRERFIFRERGDASSFNTFLTSPKWRNDDTEAAKRFNRMYRKALTSNDGPERVLYEHSHVCDKIHEILTSRDSSSSSPSSSVIDERLANVVSGYRPVSDLLHVFVMKARPDFESISAAEEAYAFFFRALSTTGTRCILVDPTAERTLHDWVTLFLTACVNNNVLVPNPRLKVRKPTHISGPSAVGKSTLLRVLKDLFGGSRVVSLIGYDSLMALFDRDTVRVLDTLNARCERRVYEHAFFDDPLYASIFDGTRIRNAREFRDEFERRFDAMESSDPLRVSLLLRQHDYFIVLPASDDILNANYINRLREQKWNGIDPRGFEDGREYVLRQIQGFEMVAARYSLPIIRVRYPDDACVEFLNKIAGVAGGRVGDGSKPTKRLHPMQTVSRNDICVFGPPQRLGSSDSDSSYSKGRLIEAIEERLVGISRPQDARSYTTFRVRAKDRTQRAIEEDFVKARRVPHPEPTAYEQSSMCPAIHRAFHRSDSSERSAFFAAVEDAAKAFEPTPHTLYVFLDRERDDRVDESLVDAYSLAFEIIRERVPVLRLLAETVIADEDAAIAKISKKSLRV